MFDKHTKISCASRQYALIFAGKFAIIIEKRASIILIDALSVAEKCIKNNAAFSFLF